MSSQCDREMATEFSSIPSYTNNKAGVYPIPVCFKTLTVELRMSDFPGLSTLIITKSKTKCKLNNKVSQVR